jgi:hypothetical protein
VEVEEVGLIPHLVLVEQVEEEMDLLVLVQQTMEQLTQALVVVAQVEQKAGMADQA